MTRLRVLTRVVVAYLVVLACAGVGVVLALDARGSNGSSAHRSGAPAASGTSTSALGPPPLATYAEKSPHVSSLLNSYSVQGLVKGATAAPTSTLTPVSAQRFRRPIAADKRFAAGRLARMEDDVSALEQALAAGDRPGAQAAWRAAFTDYLELGAVYLDPGPAAELDDAIDGVPGGLAGGVSSPRFSGLHRLEYGLWTGKPLGGLRPWAQRLSADVVRLRRLLPRIAVSPLDYATRAHEILEDAVRDLLSGQDVPWSGDGVLGTQAGVLATTEIVATLAPLLRGREAVLGVVESDLGGLRSTLAGIRRAHGGTLPTNHGLTRRESEQLDASIGQALEGLAQIPGALETTRTPAIPSLRTTASHAG